MPMIELFYCSSSSVVQTLKLSPSAFDVVHSNLTQLKLVPNAEKCCFLMVNSYLLIFPGYHLLRGGVDIESVSTYKY